MNFISHAHLFFLFFFFPIINQSRHDPSKSGSQAQTHLQMDKYLYAAQFRMAQAARLQRAAEQQFLTTVQFKGAAQSHEFPEDDRSQEEVFSRRGYSQRSNGYRLGK